MHLPTRRDTPWADHIWTLKLSACYAVMSLPARLLVFLSPQIFILCAVCADAARIVTKGVSITVTVVFYVAGNGGMLQLWGDWQRGHTLFWKQNVGLWGLSSYRELIKKKYCNPIRFYMRNQIQVIPIYTVGLTQTSSAGIVCWGTIHYFFVFPFLWGYTTVMKTPDSNWKPWNNWRHSRIIKWIHFLRIHERSLLQVKEQFSSIDIINQGNGPVKYNLSIP